MAASGSTVTTMPAAAGDMPQPETSRSTRRKSAATRPPERKSNAALALRCGRPAGSREPSPRRCPGAPRAARAARERAVPARRRSTSSPAAPSSMPPAPGPNAAPRMPASTQTRTARASAPGRLGKKIESGDDDERCPDRLDAARGDEQLERRLRARRPAMRPRRPGHRRGTLGVAGAGRAARRARRRARARG